MATFVGTKASLEEERRRSARECVRRQLLDYYLSVDEPTPDQMRLVAALEALGLDWPHLQLVVRRHVADDVGWDELARQWRVSNRTLIAEFQEALGYLAKSLGRLSDG